MVSHAGVMEQRFQGRGLALQPIMDQLSLESQSQACPSFNGQQSCLNGS